MSDGLTIGSVNIGFANQTIHAPSTQKTDSHSDMADALSAMLGLNNTNTGNMSYMSSSMEFSRDNQFAVSVSLSTANNSFFPDSQVGAPTSMNNLPQLPMVQPVDNISPAEIYSKLIS